MRVLGRIRLSRQTEESTSAERQREAIEQWCSLHGHTVVGWATDLDVSGSVSPFHAPELGPWLQSERLPEWDILCAYRLDRVARRVVPLNALFGLIMDEDKSLVSVSENIDLGHWVGRMVANVIAGVAEGELEAITERTRSSRQKLRELGRWHGGTVPYGYRTVQRDGGWFFEPDPDKEPRIRWIFEQAVSHRSIRSIADELNKSGVASPRGGQWTAPTITRMLRSRWIIGQADHKGRAITDDEGMPVQRMEPLLSYEEWKQVNDVLDNHARPKTNANGTGLLLHIAYCWDCDEPLYQHVMGRQYGKRSYRYWRCSGRTRKENGCTAKAFPAGDLEELVHQGIMDEIGDQERKERVWVKASDNGSLITQIDDAIATAREEKDLGLYEGDNEGYLSRLQRLMDRRKALSAVPVSDSGYQLRGMGESYREAWDRMNDEERREMLIKSGIKAKAKTGPTQYHVIVPPDIQDRVS